MSQNYVNFLKFGIKNVHKSILNNETTITKLCHDSLRRIDDTKHLNSFITILKDEALEKAAKLDEALQQDAQQQQRQQNHPLYGIPISIKDNYCMSQTLATCASRMLHNFVPPYDATVVKKLLAANCIIMGKTNLDEFSMGSSSTTSFFGPTANSWKNTLKLGDKPNSTTNARDWYMAGGSSTGSAVSVSSGTCFASLASDTGGSARQPASLTGVIGFKPTYGLISRFGLIPLAHCLDVVSILAKNVDDAQIIFETIIGQDENDLTTLDHKQVLKSCKPNNLQENNNSNTRVTLRIGVPEEFILKGDMTEDVSKEFNNILRKLITSNNNNNNNNRLMNENINIEVIKLSLPNSSLATECYTIISSAEIASNMSCYDGVKYGYSTKFEEELLKNREEQQQQQFDRDQFYKLNRDQGFGSEVKKRILLGNYFLLEGNRETYFEQALKLRRLISDEFERAFLEKEVDVIMMPSTPSTSVSHEDWLKKKDNNRLFHEDYYLIPSNIANLPSISIPAGLSDSGLPVGLQLIANKFHDRDLLTISKVFERMNLLQC